MFDILQLWAGRVWNFHQGVKESELSKCIDGQYWRSQQLPRPTDLYNNTQSFNSLKWNTDSQEARQLTCSWVEMGRRIDLQGTEGAGKRGGEGITYVMQAEKGKKWARRGL